MSETNNRQANFAYIDMLFPVHAFCIYLVNANFIRHSQAIRTFFLSTVTSFNMKLCDPLNIHQPFSLAFWYFDKAMMDK